jgi:hypothetical protein
VIFQVAIGLAFAIDDADRAQDWVADALTMHANELRTKPIDKSGQTQFGPVLLKWQAEVTYPV